MKIYSRRNGVTEAANREMEGGIEEEWSEEEVGRCK